MEVLKQPQYQPVPVAEQVAMIHAATNGLVDDVPVNRIREFEAEFIESMRLKDAGALAAIAQTGKMTDEAKAAVEQTAKDIAARMSQ